MKRTFVKEKFKTKAEWLKARGIGGSDAAVIMGEGAWKTKAQLYDEVILKKGVKDISNERMQEGVKSEDHIRKLFLIHNKEYKAVEPPKRSYWLYRRKDFPTLTLTPDCLATDEMGKHLFIEIKDKVCYGRKEIEAYKQGMIDTQYKWQCLHYFVVLDDIQYGYLLVNFNLYEKVNEKWVFDHSETYPILITRANWKDDIEKLKEEEIKFSKLDKRPPLVLNL